MNIGILKPGGNGSLFQTTGPLFADAKMNIDKMLKATETDLEKIIIAKGFTTAGSYSTFDEMTYSQKENATLILHPIFEVDLQVTNVPFGAKTATISGTVVLEFQEPMSREKVWVKRLELEPMTKNVTMNLANGPGNQLIEVVSTNSVTDLLNTFYPTVMQKMWVQLDPREIMSLRRDSDRLKAKTTYRGG